MRLPKIEYKRDLHACDAEFASPDNQRLWECTQEDCDGVHHYYQVSPWQWDTQDQELPYP